MTPPLLFLHDEFQIGRHLKILFGNGIYNRLILMSFLLDSSAWKSIGNGQHSSPEQPVGIQNLSTYSARAVISDENHLMDRHFPGRLPTYRSRVPRRRSLQSPTHTYNQFGSIVIRYILNCKNASMQKNSSLALLFLKRWKTGRRFLIDTQSDDRRKK